MKRILLLALVVSYAMHLRAQDAQTMAKYKAVFTINFIRYIGWPDEARKGDFVIGVVRDKLLSEQFRAQSEGKKFGYQSIVIKDFSKEEDITDCQILYYSDNSNFSRNSADVMSRLNGKNSLIVTETEGAIDKGSMINFVVRDQRLKFEVSAQNASKFGLIFSNSLTTLSNAIIK